MDTDQRHRGRTFESRPDDNVLERNGFRAAIKLRGQCQRQAGPRAGKGRLECSQVVGKDGALHQHRVVQRERRASLERIGKRSRLVDGTRKCHRRRAAIDRVRPTKEIARLEVAHGAHINRQSQVRAAGDVKDPGCAYRANVVGILGVDDAEEDVRIAFLNNAEAVGREDAEAVVQYRKRNRRRDAALVFLESVARGQEGAVENVRETRQPLVSALDHVERQAIQDLEVLERKRLAAAIRLRGQGDGKLRPGTHDGGKMRRKFVREQHAIDQHGIVERDGRAAFHGVGVRAGLVDSARERNHRGTTVNAVFPHEEIGRFEIAHGAHVDRKREVRCAGNVEHPGRTDRASIVRVLRIRDAEEDVGVAVFDDAKTVRREYHKAVVEHRKRDRRRDESLVLLEAVARG